VKDGALVADASLCGAWLLPDEASDRADALLEALVAGRCQLIVPALWWYELTNLVRIAQRRRRLTRRDGQAALQALDALPAPACDVPDGPARQQIEALARDHALTAYDAAYLELAQRLKLPLLSADQRLETAARELGLHTTLA
jgi:predicted nucleic acid-binding protein